MASMAVGLEVVTIEKPDDANVIIGQAHFIKTVEDLHETLTGVSPHLRFGVAFCEASAARLVRRSGNDDELTGLATANASGRGIVGVIDGSPPVGVETDADVADRHRLLRDIGYKL